MSMVMRFDGTPAGTGGYVNCGAGASLNINGANQLTICVRMKVPTAIPVGSVGVISKDGNGAGFQYMIYMQTATNILGYIHDGANPNATPIGTLVAGAIVHVACVLTAARLKLYINGVEISAPGTARTVNPQSQAGWSLYLGCYGGVNTHSYNGMISEAQVYNRDLSSDEVNYNMAHTNNPKRNGCVLNLTQESLFGGQWKDLSGNANHGTLVGGVAPIPQNNLAGRNGAL